MRALIQRCKAARVEVEGKIVGSIDFGYTVLLGVTHQDTEADAQALATKIAGLRIFEDEHGKMNRSILEKEGAAILTVSQFTLYGDCRQGRRPSFTSAAPGMQANQLYETFNDKLRQHGLVVETGQFGAMMDVHLVNWGPVTFWLDTQEMNISK